MKILIKSPFSFPPLEKGGKGGFVFIACLIIFFEGICFSAQFSQIVSSTEVYKGTSVNFTLTISSAVSISNVRFYYADGGYAKGHSYLQKSMTEISTYSFSATAAPTICGNFDYFYFAQVDGSNYCYCSTGVVTNFQTARKNPFLVNVSEPDYTPPYIVHQPDGDDDEDDGFGGKYKGIAANGIADEDEDGCDHDPPEFANGLDESDTGHPWGITTKALKGQTISIKAIFLDYDGAASFKGEARLYYRIGNGQYKKVLMSAVKGTTYVYDVKGAEVLSDIEYVFVAVDEAENVSLCDKDSFMYSGDGKDNDGDGSVDEENYDGSDNDADGFTDEDLGTGGSFLMKADGKCINKSEVSCASPDEWIDDALYDENVSCYAKPFTVKVFDDSSEVPGFDGEITKDGTIKEDINNDEITTAFLFPGDVELTIDKGVLNEDLTFCVSVPDDVQPLPVKSGLRETGFVRKISARTSYGNEIENLSREIVFNFRRPLNSLDSNYLTAYFYDGVMWIPVGGERADITADQQIGYGKPMIVRTNRLGIFQIVEDYSLWRGVGAGITKLTATPKVFCPQGGGCNSTTISFFFASNDSPATIGDVPLYAEVPVNVKIFDIRGNLIRSLAKEERVKFLWKQGSLIQFGWNGRDDFGNLAQPGFYLVQVQATNDFEWLTQDANKNYFQRTGVVVIR